MIKAIIFDFFGVIFVDTVMLAWRELGGEKLPHSERQAIDDAWQARWQGLLSADEVEDITCKALGVSKADWQAARQRHAEKNIDEELLAYVRDLRKTYKIGLLSNVERLDRYMSLDELHKYFDVVAASDLIGYSKPDREAFDYVLTRLGVKPEEAIMVDDIDRYCAAAQALGMQSIQYEDLAQLKTALNKLLAA